MNHNLNKKHKSETKNSWRQNGLILTTNEEFEEIYQRYISSIHCELCGNAYKSNFNRQMDHVHHIDDKWGWFRNVVCNKCNGLKFDRKMNAKNTSGYKGINKQLNKMCKLGFTWRFRATVNGKEKTIKQSVDYDYLKKFADKWKIDNNYHT